MIEKNYSISGDVFLTIAHISDLHNKDGRQAIESMRNRKPDIIVITGDLVLRRRPKDDMLIVQSEKNVLSFLSECAQIAPTYMSLGNHEVMLNQDDLELISQTGVELLDNRFVKTDKYVIGGLTSAYVSRYRSEIEEMEAGEEPGKRSHVFSALRRRRVDEELKAGEEPGKKSHVFSALRRRRVDEELEAREEPVEGLSGSSDQNRRNEDSGEKAVVVSKNLRTERYPILKPFLRPEMEKTDYAWLDTFAQVPRYRILLSHHPEYWCLEEPMLSNRDIDLVLSGHAHGGQFRLFGQGFFAPGQGWFPKYTSGIHHGKRGRMIISKGMANTVMVAPRLFNPTEVVYIEVVRGDLY